MDLLQSPEGSGYPTEYLIARIMGRRVYLVKDWNDVLFSPGTLENIMPACYRKLVSEHAKEGVWKRLLEEYRWVYFQMNKTLRKVFYPFFMYSEIKTILWCLRYKMEKETRTAIEDILCFSLLSKEVKEALKKEGEMPLILEEFENKFLSSKGKPGGLKEIFLRDGLKGVEEGLTNGFMEQTVSSRLHPVLSKFFIFLVDIRNILTLYKYERWAVKTDPVFIKGGGISRSILRKAVQAGGILRTGRFVHQLTGVSISGTDASEIENTLLTGLTKAIRSMAIENVEIGLILDYLWKIHIEAQNFSILLYSRDIERTNLRKELVIL